MEWKEASAAFIGAILAAAGTAIYHHLFGVKRVTQAECDKRHEQDESKCAACRKETDLKMCSYNHEMTAIKSLLMLIAIKLEVPPEKIQELVRHDH